MPDRLGKAGPLIPVSIFPVNLIVIAAYRKGHQACKTPKSHLHAFSGSGGLFDHVDDFGADGQ